MSASVDGTVRVGRLADRTCARVLDLEGRCVGALADLDGGRLVTGCATNKLRIWDAATGALLLTRDTNAARVRAIWAIAALWGGRLATGHVMGAVVLWRLGAGGAAAPVVLAGHTDCVNAFAVVAPGSGVQLLATASNDCTVRLWDVDAAACVRVLG